MFVVESQWPYKKCAVAFLGEAISYKITLDRVPVFQYPVSLA